MGPEELIREGHDETQTQKKQNIARPARNCELTLAQKCDGHELTRVMRTPNIVAVAEGHRQRQSAHVARGSQSGREAQL